MNKEQYQDFKKWLIKNNKTEYIPYEIKQWDIRNGFPNRKYDPSDVIDWLFATNKIIDRYNVLGKDLFSLISKRQPKHAYPSSF